MTLQNSSVNTDKKGFFLVWFFDDCTGGGCGFDQFKTRDEALKEYDKLINEKNTDYYLLTIIEGESIKGFF